MFLFIFLKNNTLHPVPVQGQGATRCRGLNSESVGVDRGGNEVWHCIYIFEDKKKGSWKRVQQAREEIINIEVMVKTSNFNIMRPNCQSSKTLKFVQLIFFQFLYLFPVTNTSLLLFFAKPGVVSNILLTDPVKTRIFFFFNSHCLECSDSIHTFWLSHESLM